MHLLYCDETNMEERSGDFLIYGGLMIDSAQAQGLSDAIDEARRSRGVPRDHRLKFNPGPEGFSHAQFIDLKRAVLEAARTHGARLLVYTILHDIARNPDEARRNGINTVCYHFHCALNRVDQPGLVLIDRFNDAGNEIDAHLRDKFTVGLTGMPYGNELPISNIVGFHYSAIGQSHFASLIDIALGSLRFSVNAHTRQLTDYTASARTLLSLLAPLFWREQGDASISEIGFAYSPKVVQVSHYRQRYQALKDFLATGGIDTKQEITGQRQY